MAEYTKTRWTDTGKLEGLDATGQWRPLMNNPEFGQEGTYDASNQGKIDPYTFDTKGIASFQPQQGSGDKTFLDRYAPAIAASFWGPAAGAAIGGGEAAAATAGEAGGAGGAAMPAAIPEFDPTFGGALKEVAPGVFDAASSASGGEAVASGGSQSDAGGPAMPAATAPGADIGGQAFSPSGPGPSGAGTSFTPSGGPSGGVTAVGSGGVDLPAGAQDIPGVVDPSPPYVQPSDGSTADAIRGAMNEADKAATGGSATPGIGSRALSALTSNPFAAGALGLNVMGGINARRQGNKLSNDLRASAAGAKSASDRLLAEGADGSLPPAVMSQLQKSYQDKVSEINQRYANMGRDPRTDSAAQAEIARAKDAMDAQVSNYGSSLTSQGLQAAQIAQGPTTQAAIASAQADQQFAASQAQLLQALAQMQSRQGAGAAPAQ